MSWQAHIARVRDCEFWYNRFEKAACPAICEREKFMLSLFPANQLKHEKNHRSYSIGPVRPVMSPSQVRHISLRRLLRDNLKRLYFAIYKLGVRLGVYILPVHYYTSEPNIIELARTIDLW